MGRTDKTHRTPDERTASVMAEALEARQLFAASPSDLAASFMTVFGHIATGEVPFSIAINSPHVPNAEPSQDPGSVDIPTPTETRPEPKTLRDLADPAITYAAVGYRNFSDRPLFDPTGPSPDDIRQGGVADCYLLCVLSSVAEVDPNRIRDLIDANDDGTYTVHFVRNGKAADVTVDADLPINSSGQTAYAHADGDAPIWVAIIEKAFAQARTGQKSYGSLNMGWMDETYNLLGVSASSDYSATSPRALLEKVDVALSAGKSVTYGTRTPADGANLIGSHAYSVESVERDTEGTPVAVKVRNPWGTDGYRVDDGVNDGYVTLTAQQFYSSMIGYVQASV